MALHRASWWMSLHKNTGQAQNRPSSSWRLVQGLVAPEAMWARIALVSRIQGSQRVTWVEAFQMVISCCVERQRGERMEPWLGERFRGFSTLFSRQRGSHQEISPSIQWRQKSIQHDDSPRSRKKRRRWRLIIREIRWVKGSTQKPGHETVVLRHLRCCVDSARL